MKEQTSLQHHHEETPPRPTQAKTKPTNPLLTVLNAELPLSCSEVKLFYLY